MAHELSRTLDNVQDTLVTDLKGIVAEADKLMNEVACATAEDFAAARTTIGNKLGAARARIDGARAAVVKQTECAAEATQEYVRNNPWQVLGVAAATGIILGFLLTRR